MSALRDHLKTGATTVCRAWDIKRRDGTFMAFTDHDRDLVLDGVTYSARGALSASELEKSFGMTADNAAVAGALQSAAITEEEILNGAFDDADIRSWIVNWASPEDKEVTFAGYIGTVEIADGRFTAELRSYAERLNQPYGRRYLRRCGAELGTPACGVDLDDPSFLTSATIKEIKLPTFTVDLTGAFAEGWFLGGVAVLQGRSFRIDRDISYGGLRRISLPDYDNVASEVGSEITLIAGCDKAMETCREKFYNLLNFQGFPFIPGDDSAVAVPQKGGGN